MNEINASKILLAILLSLVLTACGGSGSSGPADADGDGVPDASDAFPNDPKESKDTDGDGVGDNGDAFPNDPTETLDTDGDGVGNNTDVFPNDPSETKDNDKDGLGDNQDPNDDNDAKLDNEDPFPFDATEWEDIDNDNIGDNKDLDVGSSNEASAQLDSFYKTGRAILFVGSDTDPIAFAAANVQVVNAGDVNGDNKNDLLIGVGEESGRDGKVYLFFGSETPWPEKIDLFDIPETIDHIILNGGLDGAYTNLIGISLSALGDVNGDSIDDFILGGIGYEIDASYIFSGEAYLIFGRKTWMEDAGEDKNITMAELKSKYAITYQGQQNSGDFGERVIFAGDVNGDTYNDFLIAEYGYSSVADFDNASGRVHLMFGGEHLQPPATEAGDIRNVNTLPNSERTVITTSRLGSDPARITTRETLVGDEVLGIGNFDNDSDGYDDIAITSIHRQKTYVLFGQETWPASINLPTIENGKGFIFQTPAGIDDIGMGKHIAAGDLNGDNIPELIIAQTKSVDAAKPNKLGDVVILKGGVGQWPATLSLDNLTNFFGAVWSTSEKLALGSGLAVLPDDNNDGFGELLIAAPKPESTGEGLIFKVAGNANLGAKELNSTTTDAGVEIIRNLHTEIAGTNIRTLGDYNGDGINEFVIDIQDASTNGKGEATSEDAADPVRSENGLFYVIQGYSTLYPETQTTQ
jgi:hypothetical protein